MLHHALRYILLHQLACPGDAIAAEVGKMLHVDAPDADYATNPQAYVISTQQVTSADILSLDMARGGGFAISFE